MVLNVAGMDDKHQMGNKELSQLCCESEIFLINNLRTYKTWLPAKGYFILYQELLCTKTWAQESNFNKT